MGNLSTLDSGSTAWILTSTALVLFMTLPGLALFYGGLVRTQNVLSVLMQCFAITALVTLIWLAFGYSVALGPPGYEAGAIGLRSFVGGLSKAFLSGIGAGTLWGAIPEPLFFAYQLNFAIITPALIVGAFAERMSFSALLLFSGLWLVLVYLPICHMVWGGQGAFFADLGVFDFAGGIVVHITAGIAALVACLVIGPRHGFPRTAMPPHNLTMTVTGTGMLWVGWFGFNAGSALAANGTAATALVATHVSASAAALTWMAIEWVRFGRPSVLGLATGAVAGLAAVTPASGFVGPAGALVIGTVAAAICWYASTAVKRRFGYDDSLDVFGVHGVGGFLGTVLVAVFASDVFGGNQAGLAIGRQLAVQLGAAVFTVVYSAGVTWGILRAVAALTELRVDDAQERRGLDISIHGEEGYHL
ncbi:MAG: ammonium transporter [Deltaproteobacteria bacterium]|nr:ammonium transporter [Deltaproteobacteria bacterium]